MLKGHNLLNSLVSKAEHLAGSVLVGVKMHPARLEAFGQNPPPATNTDTAREPGRNFKNSFSEPSFSFRWGL